MPKFQNELITTIKRGAASEGVQAVLADLVLVTATLGAAQGDQVLRRMVRADFLEKFDQFEKENAGKG